MLIGLKTYFERFSRRISHRSATWSREVLIILERAPSSTSPFLLPRFAPSSHPFPSINVCLGLKSIAGGEERPEYSLQFQLCPSMLDRTGHFSPAALPQTLVVGSSGGQACFFSGICIHTAAASPSSSSAYCDGGKGGWWPMGEPPNGACRHAASKLDHGASGGVQSGWQ